MKDNLSIVITIIVIVLLMVLFPLYNFFERQDDMSYNLVLKATTNFADQVMNNGYIDQNMYNNLVNELGNTGNIYDIQIEAHRKVLTKDKDNITGDTYVEQSYIDYNDDIFNSLEKSNGVMDKQLKNNIYLMNENDEIYVKVKNSNTTLAGSLFNSIIVTSSKTRIEVNYGGIIKNNSWAKIDATYKGHIQAPGAPKVTVGGEEVKSGNSIQISYNKFIDTDIEATSVAFNNQDTNIPNEIEKYIWSITDNSTKESYDYNTSNKLEKKEDFKDGNTYKIEVYSVDKLGYRSDSTIITLELKEPSSTTGETRKALTNEDLEKVKKYLENNEELTSQENELYDIDNNQKITAEDMEYINEYLENGYIIGDVNQDFKITDEDSKMLLEYIAKVVTLNETQLKAADVNKNGVIDKGDSTEILNLISKAQTIK
jgi:hypothetical protein